MMGMIASVLWIVTGPRQVGKSTFCRAMAETARKAGWDVAGLLSPAQFENGIKIGIRAEDLRTGESQRLASVSRESPEDISFGMWYFEPQTLAWGNRILSNSLPCDLLIIDELGPLELTYQMGWQTALEILPMGGYHVALVVLRPELQTTACQWFAFSEIILLDSIHTLDSWVGEWWVKMEKCKSQPVL